MRGSWPSDHRQRATLLLRWADKLEAASVQLIQALVTETGKPRSEAQVEVAGAVEALRYNAGLARLITGRAGTLPDGSEAHLIRQPVGPTVFIVPWNWPVLLLLRDLAPALAAGVTALIKPAPQTVHVTAQVLRIGIDAGVPPTVIQLIVGDTEVGRALVRHPQTAAVAFTGSTGVGAAILRDASETMTRPLLELGGKGTMVVFDDANLSTAVATAARASTITSGQMCMACTRLLVPQHRLTEAEDVLRNVLAEIRVGDPHDRSTAMGPLVGDAAAEKVHRYLDLARRTARLIVGGDIVRPDGLAGHFVTPAAVTDLTLDSPLVQDDIFGPILTLEGFTGEEDALARANAVPFGLAASVWTPDASRALRVARQLTFGTVWINGYNRAYPEMPSGGFRASGMGRTRGVEGIEQFTELKHIHWSIDGREDGEAR